MSEEKRKGFIISSYLPETKETDFLVKILEDDKTRPTFLLASEVEATIIADHLIDEYRATVAQNMKLVKLIAQINNLKTRHPINYDDLNDMSTIQPLTEQPSPISTIILDSDSNDTNESNETQNDEYEGSKQDDIITSTVNNDLISPTFSSSSSIITRRSIKRTWSESSTDSDDSSQLTSSKYRKSDQYF